jgi:proteasome activator-like protein
VGAWGFPILGAVTNVGDNPTRPARTDGAGPGARAGGPGNPGGPGADDGTDDRTARELVQPEVMGGGPGDETADEPDEQVSRPTKLIRIASMVRTMLDEVRRAPLDEGGRRRLREIHERSVQELEGILSPDLRDELEQVVLPFTTETPSESELRLAQAQLVGWLEGLFHGIQATLFTQQAMAQGQLDEVRRRRALEGGQDPGMPGVPPSGYL